MSGRGRGGPYYKRKVRGQTRRGRSCRGTDGFSRVARNIQKNGAKWTIDIASNESVGTQTVVLSFHASDLAVGCVDI